MKKRKLLTAFVMSAVLSTCVIVPAYATEETTEVTVNDVSIPVIVENYEQYTQEENGIESDLLLNAEPRFTYIRKIGIGVTIKETTAHVYGECESYEKTKISVSIKLQKNDNGTWKDIKSDSNSVSNNTFCDISKSYSIDSGYEYRAIISVNANGETATRTSNIEYCK